MNREMQLILIRLTKVILLIIQFGLVALLVHSAFKELTGAGAAPQENMSFDQWYGNWIATAVTSIGVLLALYFLTRPRKPKEWKGAGMAAAFFISLFTEMYGIPLTIYLLAPVLGVAPKTFGMYESHLWAYLLSQTNLLRLETGVYLVMTLSTILVLLGFGLLALGWNQVYRGRGQLVTRGLYRKFRHPQYLGLILIVVGFLIMWPTLLPIILAPLLITKYILLAGEEDRELEKKFGENFRRYRETVSAFIPSMRSSQT